MDVKKIKCVYIRFLLVGLHDEIYFLNPSTKGWHTLTNLILAAAYATVNGSESFVSSASFTKFHDDKLQEFFCLFVVGRPCLVLQELHL